MIGNLDHQLNLGSGIRSDKKPSFSIILNHLCIFLPSCITANEELMKGVFIGCVDNKIRSIVPGASLRLLLETERNSGNIRKSEK